VSSIPAVATRHYQIDSMNILDIYYVLNINFSFSIFLMHKKKKKNSIRWMDIYERSEEERINITQIGNIEDEFISNIYKRRKNRITSQQKEI
jgi:hypothetical protein